MEDEREWKDLTSAEKLLAIKSYLQGMNKLDDNDEAANKARLEWIREHLPAYKAKGNKSYIFVSYSHRDYEKVYSDLAYFSYNSQTRVRFWYDEGLPIGQDWEKAAGEFMADPNCVGVVFYLSKNLLLSDAVYKEIESVKRLNKKHFAIALDPEQYSAELIFRESKWKELERVFDKKTELEEFFPAAHTALIMGKDNVQARIAKISEVFDVTEEVLSDFVCKDVAGGLCLKDYCGKNTEVYIPSYIDDKPVVEIDCEFRNAVKIYIPDTVQFISTEKFDSAYNLEEIKVDLKNKNYYDLNGVLCAKKNEAYYDMGGILCSRSMPDCIVRAPVNWNWENQFTGGAVSENINFEKPKGIRITDADIIRDAVRFSVWEMQTDRESFEYEMEKEDFKNFYVRLNGDNKKRSYSDSFYSSHKRYCRYMQAKEMSVLKDIKSIGAGAFKNCRRLDYLFLPDNIGVILNEAFSKSNLKLIVLPEKLKRIEEKLFCNCTRLQAVLTVTDCFIEREHFETIDCAVLNGNIHTVGARAFENTSIESVIFGNRAEKIEISAFAKCYKLTELKLSNSLKSIDDYAFSKCYLLGSANLNEGMENIGSCFAECLSLSNITIPSTVKSISITAFSKCKNIRQITFNGKKCDWYKLWDGAKESFLREKHPRQFEIADSLEQISKSLRVLNAQLGKEDYVEEDGKPLFYRSPENVPSNIKKAKIICTDGVIDPSEN